MDTIQEIQFENDANGNRQFIKINLEKYGDQLKPFLKKVGIELEKDAFYLEWENAVSSEDFLKKTIGNIKQLPWKK